MTRPEVRPVTAQGLSRTLTRLGFQRATKTKLVGFVVGCVQGNTTPTVCIVGFPSYGLPDMAQQLQAHGYHCHVDEAGEVLHVESRSPVSKEERMPTRKTIKRNVASIGFGFQPTESHYHFLVTIPSRTPDLVTISEHDQWPSHDPTVAPAYATVRTQLPYPTWCAIADAVKAEWNQRLRKRTMKTGQWNVGQTPVARLFGKELVLLCWAIEDADPRLIPVAIRNWQGLAPEERWWLCTMTNAATGHAVAGRNRGWRKAVRYIMTENPVSDIHLQHLMSPVTYTEEVS